MSSLTLLPLSKPALLKAKRDLGEAMLAEYSSTELEVYLESEFLN